MTPRATTSRVGRSILDGPGAAAFGAPHEQTATTDVNGEVTFTITAPGAYRITEEARAGWTPIGATFFDFTAVSGGSYGPYTFVNFQNMVVTVNKHDTEGDNIAGWEIYLDGPGAAAFGAPHEQTATTDVNGEVTFTITAPGAYRITEEARAGWTPIGATFFDFTAVSGGSYGPYTFVNFQNMVVTVNKHDTEGDNIAGWEIYLDGPGAAAFGAPHEQTATTDVNGEVTFTITAPGAYRITEEARAGWTPIGATFFDFTAVSGGSYGPYTFVNFQNMVVTVNKHDTEGDNIAGWEIYLDGPGAAAFGAPHEQTATTDVNGEVTFTITAPGAYRITEEARAGWTPIGATFFDFTAVSGGSYGPYTFVNFQNMVVTVNKHDTEGDNIAGWEIYLDGPGAAAFGAPHEQTATTDVNGEVTFTITAPGAYRITEEARAGWTPIGATFFDFTAVSGGSYGPYTFVNFQNMVVTVNKHDTEGDNIAGWEIYLDGPGAAAFGAPHEQTATTDVNGEVTFTITAPGAYRITEEARAGWTPIGATFFDFTAVSGGSYGPYTFVNFQNMVVTVNKHDTEGDNIAGWEIYLDGPGAAAFGAPHEQTATTDVNGEVTFTITAPGAYRITEEARAGWTPIGATFFDFTAVSGGSYGPYTFVNFELVTITADKWDDLNGNAIKDPDEPSIVGWQLTLSGPADSIYSGAVTQGSPASWVVKKGGTYTISEELQSGWVHTTPATVDVTVQSGDTPPKVWFGNFAQSNLCVFKYEDFNGDGKYDAADGDKPIEGWHVWIEDIIRDHSGWRWVY